MGLDQSLTLLMLTVCRVPDENKGSIEQSHITNEERSF